MYVHSAVADSDTAKPTINLPNTCNQFHTCARYKLYLYPKINYREGYSFPLSASYSLPAPMSGRHWNFYPSDRGILLCFRSASKIRPIEVISRSSTPPVLLHLPSTISSFTSLVNIIHTVLYYRRPAWWQDFLLVACHCIVNILY